VVTEATARQRCLELLEQEHALGARRPKVRSLYQVVCRDDAWVGVILWTGSCWHLKARDQWIGWDALTRSERLPLADERARFQSGNQRRARRQRLMDGRGASNDDSQ
jgi:hypothetical protein